jgi:small subunit ribosomal protein S13
MLRIAGINIPENKEIRIGLTYIYGIGESLSRRMLREVNIDCSKKGKDLNKEELNQLRKIIEEQLKVEGELRREKMLSIKRLKDIGCWRGIRHLKRLPVRGQKTRSNSRTVRGNVRKTVGSGKRKAPAPK